MTKLPVSFRNIVSHKKQLPDWLKLTIVRAGLIGDANMDQRDFCSFYSFFLNLFFSFDRQRHGPIKDLKRREYKSKTNKLSQF